LNYLDNVLSWEEAHARDFDEAVRLNERGEVVSATMANIFWVKDGAVHTPAPSTERWPASPVPSDQAGERAFHSAD